MRKNPFHSGRIAITVTIFIFFSAVQRISGAPAYPYPIDVEQPDGSVITVQLQGDEWVNWRTTLDDYTMLVNGEGELEYAVLDGYGDLQPSGIRARNERERTDEERKFLQKQPKNLRYSASQINIMRQMRAVRDEALEDMQQAPIQQAPISGTVRTAIILVDFNERRFSKTKKQFEDLFNQLNYTNNGSMSIPGSMKDLFLSNSYGKFELQADVYGPYTMSQPISYYDHNGSGGNGAGGKMATEAVKAAIAGGCDFSKYPDPANSANAIAVHIIFAGYGQEAGAPKNQSIWSHASSLYPSAITANGKKVAKYSCSPELRGGGGGTTITSIGVIAHELGHSVLGLPDLYDSDGASSGGEAFHIGPWCLMATGTWNNNGDSPAFLSAEMRVNVGWANSILLDSPQNVTLPDPTTLSQGVVYRINTTTNNEYFLLENRQKTDWDRGIPASGMLVYHVDRAGVSWTGNKVNANPSRRGYYVKQAGCATANGCGQNTVNGRTTDVFPRSTYTSFTDATTPNSKSWAGANTNKPVTDITHNTSAKTISFKFMGGGTVSTTYTVTFNANGGTVSPANATTGTDGKLTSLPTPARTGYTFNGWFTAATGGTAVNTNTVFTQNTTIYARWTANASAYTITFNANGGTVSPTTATTGTNGRLTSLPTPTRTGYTFNGWFTAATGGTAVNTNTVFTQNTTIYARWTASTYTVTFNANGGTVSPTTATTGTNGRLTSLPTPARTGYTFNGWFTAATGGNAVNTNTVFTQNTTIYAQWTASTYTVTFNSNNGGANVTETVNYNTKITAPQNPTREGYVFDGWYDDGDDLFDFDTPITQDLELTAKWTAEVSTGVPAKSDSRCGVRITGDNIVTRQKAEISVVIPIPNSDRTETAKEIKVVIYDNTGNVIYSGENSSGSGAKVTWNLTNNAGRTVANGAYLVIVEAKGQSGKVYSYYDKIGVNVKK